MDLLILAQETNAFSYFIQTLGKALALGSIYAIMALGFVLVFKGTQVLNFAHGAIAMSGALFLSMLVADGGIPFTPFSNPFIGGSDGPANPLAVGGGGGPSFPIWLLNLFIALVLAGILGLVLERFAIRPMVGQPLFSMAVITLGLEIAIRAFAFDAASISRRNVLAPWGNSTFEFLGAQLSWTYVACMVAAAISFVAVFFFYRSKLGVAMRAVAFDQEAAMAQGINVGRVFAIAWALGAALGTLGAVFFAMSPFLPGSVDEFQHPLLAFRVLPVIVLGGLDSVQGALYGGLMIGAAEIFAGQYLSQYSGTLGAGYQQIVPFIVMLAVLLVRPYGLFGTEEIRRV